ncbi:DUF4231 domain-containing protein [Aeromicrobium sp. Leaf272]|uniref:DUF4231 domain-containing protein n=1 Tax=Aeromicrobium sp. Leaf272 TaxID=1736317 RepID=UPI00138F709D|nr:DUF4231 domain-containing protein [Aeromicrobium sp. Leaf272]
MADPLYDGGYPALHDSANSASLEGQKHFLRALKVRLTGLLVSALGGALLIGGEESAVGGAVALAGFTVALACELYVSIAKPDRRWYEGRAAAESAKTLAWRYAVRGESFAEDTREVDRYFSDRVREVLEDLKDLDLGGSKTGNREQISAMMREIRASTFEERRSAYRDGRIEDQRDWYESKSVWNAKRRTWWLSGTIGAQTIGMITGLIVLLDVVRIDLVGLIAAGAATMTSWSQAKQYSTLATAYGITAQELATIKSEIDSVPESEWADYVGQAEEAISREHTLWRASRGIRGPRF